MSNFFNSSCLTHKKSIGENIRQHNKEKKFQRESAVEDVTPDPTCSVGHIDRLAGVGSWPFGRLAVAKTAKCQQGTNTYLVSYLAISIWPRPNANTAYMYDGHSYHC